MVSNPHELFFKCLQYSDRTKLGSFDPDDLTLEFVDWWEINKGRWDEPTLDGALVFGVETADEFADYCVEYDDPTDEYFGVFITKQSSHTMIKREFAKVLQQMYPVERGRPTNPDRKSAFAMVDLPIGSTRRIADLALSMKVFEAVKAKPQRPKWRIAVDHKVSSFYVSKSRPNNDPERMHHDADERRELRREVTRRCNRIKDLIAGVEDRVEFPAPPGYYKANRPKETASEEAVESYLPM